MTADIAETVPSVRTCRSHLNINTIADADQPKLAGFAVHRQVDYRQPTEPSAVPMSIDQRLAELGITLPEPAAPVAAYVPAVSRWLLHISRPDQFAEDGSLIKGRLGEDMDLDGGIAAARRAASCCSPR